MKAGDLVLLPHRKGVCVITEISHVHGAKFYLVCGDGRLEWVSIIKEVISESG